jgi:uncharacterized protein YdeI (YjbR/CyaY-like superfamily)
MSTVISSGVVHTVPADLKRVLRKAPKTLALWNALTPLARNEWICWTVTVKKTETRTRHIERLVGEIIAGKRRPCCFAGCPHRSQ